MPVFNKRKRDDKGAGKIKLEDNSSEQKDPSSNNRGLIIGGAVLTAIGLTAVFFLSSGEEDQQANINNVEPTLNEPELNVQSLNTKISEKLGSIYNAKACQYGAYVDTNNNQVREGANFNYFACLYDKGAFGVLVTEGEWAGARVHFEPRDGRDGSVSVEVVGENKLADDNKTSEFHRLDYSDRVSFSSVLSSPNQIGDGVNVPNNSSSFTYTVREGGHSANAFIISGSPESGLFEVEIVNGDVYQINLNTGDFYTDSLFLNCPNYDYGNEESCPRDSFEPVKGVIQGLNGLTR
jgi:hypothetical protein